MYIQFAVSQKITNKYQIYNYTTSKTTNIQLLKTYIERRGNQSLDIIQVFADLLLMLFEPLVPVLTVGIFTWLPF